MKVRGPVVAAAALALAFTGTLAHPARADHLSRGSIHDHDNDHYRDSYWYQLQIERERIAADEEARRDVLREKRRDAIEKRLEKEQADFLERQAAIRDANRAAAMSPRGYFYRRPGSTVNALPKGHLTISVGEREYAYHEGIFFRSIGGRLAVVSAPQGALVEALPRGSSEVSHEGVVYHYYFGTFFAEAEGGYRVAEPPAGLLVGYLPEGYEREERDGKLHFTFAGNTYRPYNLEGVTVFRVTGD